jgi:hypothetical protein
VEPVNATARQRPALRVRPTGRDGLA